MFTVKIKNKFVANKGFTLVEILITLSVILILVSTSFVSYQYVLNSTKRRICKTNLLALSAAVEIYMVEKDAFPAILGDLKKEHLQKGFAYAMQESGWFTKFSHFFVKLNTPTVAYAQFLTHENLGEASESIFNDPADKNGGASYGINTNLIDKRLDEISDSTILIGDSDTYVFTGINQLTHRHKMSFLSSSIALMITKGKKILNVDTNNICSEEDDDIVECDDD